jgi:parvulin-like peptidyl-prolyl isomerase
MYLMQQKSQAVLQKWMDKLRKSAYIKIMNT